MNQKHETETEFGQLCYFKNHPRIPWWITVQVESISQPCPIHNGKSTGRKKRQIYVTLKKLRGSSSLRWTGLWKEKLIQQMTKRGGFQLSLRAFSYLLLLGCQRLNWTESNDVCITSSDSILLDLFFATELGIPCLHEVEHNHVSKSDQCEKLYLILTWKKNEFNSSWHFPLPLIAQPDESIKIFSGPLRTVGKATSASLKTKNDAEPSASRSNILGPVPQKSAAHTANYSLHEESLEVLKHKALILKKKLEETKTSISPKKTTHPLMKRASNIGEYFFFPNHQTSQTPPSKFPIKGWLNASERLSKTTPRRTEKTPLLYDSPLKHILRRFPVTHRPFKDPKDYSRDPSAPRLELSSYTEEKKIQNNPLIRNAVKRSRSLSRALRSLNSSSLPHNKNCGRHMCLRSPSRSCSYHCDSAESSKTPTSMRSSTFASKTPSQTVHSTLEPKSNHAVYRALCHKGSPCRSSVSSMYSSNSRVQKRESFHSLSISTPKTSHYIKALPCQRSGHAFTVNFYKTKEDLSYRTPSATIPALRSCSLSEYPLSVSSGSSRSLPNVCRLKEPLKCCDYDTAEVSPFKPSPSSKILPTEILEKIQILKRCFRFNSSDMEASLAKPLQQNDLKQQLDTPLGSLAFQCNEQSRKVSDYKKANPLQSATKNDEEQILTYRRHEHTEILYEKSEKNKALPSTNIPLHVQAARDIARCSFFESENSFRDGSLPSNLVTDRSTQDHVSNESISIAQRISALRQELSESRNQSRL